MTWPEYAVITIVAISALVGVLRGFIKEVFSLVVWFAAFTAAFHLSAPVATLLENSISLPSARTVLAFTGVFIVVLLVGGLLTYLLGKLVEKTGLDGTDRLAGGVFGLVRGVLLVVVIIMVAGLTPLPRDPWWRESLAIRSLLPLAEWAAEFLPESIASHLDLRPTELAEPPDI